MEAVGELLLKFDELLSHLFRVVGQAQFEREHEEAPHVRLVLLLHELVVRRRLEHVDAVSDEVGSRRDKILLSLFLVQHLLC